VDQRTGELSKSGLKVGLTEAAGGPAIWIEGRPIQLFMEPGADGLMATSYLPEAESLLRDHLKTLGLKSEPAGLSRLDLTTTANAAGSIATQQAILRGTMALHVQRRKPAVYFNPRSQATIETVYWVGLGKKGARHERAYAEALTHRESSSAAVRFEAQTRHRADQRRLAEDWSPSLCASVFNQKFAPMKKASEGLKIASTSRLNKEVVGLVEAGEMTGRQAERLLGYLTVRQLGIEPSRATRFRRQAELRAFGLVEAIEQVPGQPDFEIVPLQDVFEQITSNLSWN